MAPHALPQDAEHDVVPEAGQSHRDYQIAQGLTVWAAGRPIPAVVLDTKLAEILGLGLTVFYARKNDGDFTFLELKPQLPHGNTRYSGVLVSRWLNGEDMAAVPARRFFGKASATVARRRPGRPCKTGANQIVSVDGRG